MVFQPLEGYEFEEQALPFPPPDPAPHPFLAFDAVVTVGAVPFVPYQHGALPPLIMLPAPPPPAAAINVFPEEVKRKLPPPP
jgi:hypothetical protein